MANMGFGYGLGEAGSCIKKKHRFLFKIPEISASGVNSLPPMKSARPNLSFKELQVEHLNETIYFPGKPDWKPIALSLYDLKRTRNPILIWLNKLYNACDGTMQTPVDNGFILNGLLEIYDGCGNILETWIFENIWPNSIEFGELDMASSDVLTCDLTLRYARAYCENECNDFNINGLA